MYDEHVPTVDDLTDMARAAEDAALSHEGITNSEGGSASHGIANILIATSNGFSADYKRSLERCSAMVIAEQNGNMERDYDYSAAVFAADMDSPDRLATVPPPARWRVVVQSNRPPGSFRWFMTSAYQPRSSAQWPVRLMARPSPVAPVF